MRSVKKEILAMLSKAFVLLLILSTPAWAQTEAPHPFSPSAPHSWPANQFQPFCSLAFANPLVGSATACASNAQSSPQVFDVTLTGNTTWNKPTGLTSGESVIYRFAQDATGGRTVTLPTDGSIIVPNSLICTGAGTPAASCLAANTMALTGTALSVDYVGCVGHGGSAPGWAATSLECLGVSPNLISATSLCSQGSTVIGRTSGENNTALGAFICGLVTDGLIDSTASMASTGSNPYCGSGGVFDRLFIHAMANSTDALLDVCGHASATLNGSPTFTANNGFTGTANSNIWIDSGYNMSTGAGVASLNNAHMSMWSLTNMTITANQEIGTSSGSAIVIEAAYSDGNTYIKVNDNTYLATTTAPQSDGWLLAQRTGASARAYYRAASSIASDSQASTSIPNSNLFNLNVGGSPFGWPGTSAMFSAGKSFASGQITSFNARGCTYMTAVLGAKPSYCP